MPIKMIFQLQLVLGYVAGLLFFLTYMLPRLRALDRPSAHRVIATMHSFRFLGLAFIVPGVVGPQLPVGFAGYAAYGDFITGILAILALLTFRFRPLFWTFTVAFHLVGTVDMLGNYFHATQLQLPELAGQLGSMYIIPVLYVPLLMITHVVALYWFARSATVRTSAQTANQF